MGNSQDGFDRQRFIVDNNTLIEYLCGICQGVFREPKVTKCCLQTYCAIEIRQWLASNHNCPNCRSTLNQHDLLDVPKALKNLWLKLKIKCDFSEEGCGRSVHMEDLPAHVDACFYRPNDVCKHCQVFRVSAKNHKCIDSLKRQIKSLEQKLDQNSKVFDLTLSKTKDEMRKEFRNYIDKLKMKIMQNNEANTKTINKTFDEFKQMWDSTDDTKRATSSCVIYITCICSCLRFTLIN